MVETQPLRGQPTVHRAFEVLRGYSTVDQAWRTRHRFATTPRNKDIFTIHVQCSLLDLLNPVQGSVRVQDHTADRTQAPCTRASTCTAGKPCGALLRRPPHAHVELIRSHSSVSCMQYTVYTRHALRAAGSPRQHSLSLRQQRNLLPQRHRQVRVIFYDQGILDKFTQLDSALAILIHDRHQGAGQVAYVRHEGHPGKDMGGADLSLEGTGVKPER